MSSRHQIYVTKTKAVFTKASTRQRGSSMILTVGGIKGGCGKSLISTNLTVIRALISSQRVLLVDADEQGTSGDWNDHRTGLGVTTPWTTIRLKASAIRTEVVKLAKNYDDIIIDCGGRDTASLRAALTVSDVFLVPFQPKSFDIWTTAKVSVLVEEAKCLNEKLISYAFINCGGARGSDNEDARKILANAQGLKMLPVTIGLRKAFSNAAAEGLGVVEMPGDAKAISEIRALHSAIFGK
jgi:chromosome partitioning protein